MSIHWCSRLVDIKEFCNCLVRGFLTRWSNIPVLCKVTECSKNARYKTIKTTK